MSAKKTTATTGIKKKKSSRLSTIAKNNIIEQILDGRATFNDIYSENLPHILRDELIELYNFQITLNNLREGIFPNHLRGPDDVNRLYPSVSKSQRNMLIKEMDMYRKTELFGAVLSGLQEYTDVNDFHEAIATLKISRNDPLSLEKMYWFIPETWKHELFKIFAEGFSLLDPESVRITLYQWLHFEDAELVAIDMIAVPYQKMLDHLSSEYMERAREIEKSKMGRVHAMYYKKMERELNRWIFDGEAAAGVEYLHAHFDSLQTEEQIITRMRYIFELAVAKMSK